MSVTLNIWPRKVVTWEEFCHITPPKSVALDGLVHGGPKREGLRANFDHHSDVVREATMSTAMQVFFAIKGGYMTRLGGECNVYINDPDQDTSLATWFLKRYSLFTGVQSHPAINRLLTLNDRLDITGGAFPMVLDDEVAEMHAWVFDPYTNLRISGKLASADEHAMRSCVEAIYERLNCVLMGSAGRRPLHKEHVILYDSRYNFKIVDEVGGNEARYYLFSKGMDAFISLVSRAEDNTFVYSIGKRSQDIDFPVQDLYRVLNERETCSDTWGGSDIVGGCGRQHRSKLTWQEIRDIVESYLGSV